MVATRCQILRLKGTKFDFGWGSAQTPLEELTVLPRPCSWWWRNWLPLPKNPTRSRPFGSRFSALQASLLRPSAITISS